MGVRSRANAKPSSARQTVFVAAALTAVTGGSVCSEAPPDATSAQVAGLRDAIHRAWDDKWKAGPPAWRDLYTQWVGEAFRKAYPNGAAEDVLKRVTEFATQFLTVNAGMPWDDLGFKCAAAQIAGDIERLPAALSVTPETKENLRRVVTALCASTLERLRAAFPQLPPAKVVEMVAQSEELFTGHIDSEFSRCLKLPLPAEAANTVEAKVIEAVEEAVRERDPWISRLRASKVLSPAELQKWVADGDLQSAEGVALLLLQQQVVSLTSLPETDREKSLCGAMWAASRERVAKRNAELQEARQQQVVASLMRGEVPNTEQFLFLVEQVFGLLGHTNGVPLAQW
ncbi:MAG: hypothetical protein COZ57_26500 [Armatimonadetes bacterium CG_4_8_14_3_um_filter_66_20]|nr:MAG: hypothetical protein COZ57_26500 [Armatimonadetes bacterium CG_4_8_14_3_um_filter_66_20]